MTSNSEVIHLDEKRPTHRVGGPGHKDGTPTIRPSGFPDTGAFMRTQLISYRLPRADSALYGRSFTTCAVSSLFRQVDERRRGSLFAEASDAGGSLNGPTGDGALHSSSTVRSSVPPGN